MIIVNYMMIRIHINSSNSGSMYVVLLGAGGAVGRCVLARRSRKVVAPLLSTRRYYRCLLIYEFVVNSLVVD